MVVMHVENRQDTRSVLADLLGEKDGDIEGHAYFTTGVVGAAEARLKSDTVKVVVLDLGLNPDWDNRNLPRILRQLSLGEHVLTKEEAQNFYAYRLSHLAHSAGASCALLSNFPEFLGLDARQLEALREAFHAKAVFPKDDAGLESCAAWVRRELGLEAR